VLKPSGSIWINLGDKYARNGGGGRGSSDGETGRGPRPSSSATGAPEKSLIGVPWRYAIRCIDDLGLILRAEVIWSKPNGLPESVTDRVRRSHETWFHFVKEPRYFSAVDEVREAHESDPAAYMRAAEAVRRDTYTTNTQTGGKDTRFANPPNPLGKLPGSVWTIPTQPLRVPPELGVDHFAAFPMEWPRRIIRGWSPSGVCVACGEGRRPVVTRSAAEVVESHNNAAADHRLVSQKSALRVNGADYYRLRAEQAPTITGYACACPEPTAPTRPAVVLDPFGGTGTTALVARALGRHGISVDMSADYCRLAEWRTNDPGELARAMQVDKPPTELPDQLDMFGGDAA